MSHTSEVSTTTTNPTNYTLLIAQANEVTVSIHVQEARRAADTAKSPHSGHGRSKSKHSSHSRSPSRRAESAAEAVPASHRYHQITNMPLYMIE